MAGRSGRPGRGAKGLLTVVSSGIVGALPRVLVRAACALARRDETGQRPFPRYHPPWPVRPPAWRAAIGPAPFVPAAGSTWPLSRRRLSQRRWAAVPPAAPG